ncbi:MAG: undecaprenyl-diphosphate phosphatase [Cytophagales bacterium]
MDLFQAVVLAIIEGITEYLPISSTGHMIIASHFMGISGDDFTKLFTIAIQFGAILSIVVLYWKKFLNLKDYSFYLKLLVAFIPAVVLGKLLNELIDQFLESVQTVAIMLIVGGVFLLFVDKIWKNNENEEPNLKKSFFIGLFQCIAMIPGVSRSAATIVGGMSQGLSRKTAAEFSFFLAVPTMFAAGVYKLYKYFKETGGFKGEELQLFLIGNVVAFVVALFAVKFFVSFLQKRGFVIFGYYRIALGILLLFLI